ncbi:type II toxin-antitoxin system Phd/YefM family antitoxin [Candidatus Saccharibacteria bacterium]|nr:type II toxin-antitoxin system Phd/YefM family antitoxin [Candidatus Saccharibacteria bacterium]
MKVTTISNFRKDSKKYFDQVIDDQDVLLITRTDGSTIVAMPLEQYNSKVETDYLLGNKNNAKRLRRGFADAASGNVSSHAISE